MAFLINTGPIISLVLILFQRVLIPNKSPKSKKDTQRVGKLSVKGRRFKAAHDMNYLDYIVRLNFID